MHLLDKLGGKRLFNELVQIMCEKQPASAIKRMSVLGLLPFIHPSLKLVPATERILNEAGQVLAWFRLMYLDDPCEQWQVYFMVMCDGLKPDEFQDACNRLAIPGRLALRLHGQRHLVYKVLAAIKRRVKRSPEVRNSELFEWFSPLSLEMLLYLAARASNEEVKRFVSAYLTKLRNVVPQLDGKVLHSLGLIPGPQYGRIRKRLLQAKLDGEVFNIDDEILLVKSMITL